MNEDGYTQFEDTCREKESQPRQRNGHLFKVHKHNARELYPVIKALAFREERYFLYLKKVRLVNFK